MLSAKLVLHRRRGGGLVKKHGFFNNFPIYAQLKLFKPLNEYARLLHQV